jgi:hypothetical protein
MNVKYKTGELHFNFHEMLSYIDPAHKLELVESLACDDDIIKHVADQIISRWTESCCSGSSFITASADGGTPLDKAWRAVAKASGEVAKREIERLEVALRHEQAQHENTRQTLQEVRAVRRQLS